MDNSTKEYLTKVIKESITTDVDEMAIERKGTRDDSGKLTKFKHHWEKEFEGDVQPQFNDNNTSKEIPDYWIINPNLVSGEEKGIIRTGCEEAQSFIERNREWLRQLEERHNVEFRIICKQRTIWKPRSGEEGTGWRGPESTRPAKTSNQRTFNKILYEKMFSVDSAFAKMLNKLSIPTIVFNKDELKRNAQAVDLRKNKDIYKESYENDKILFKSHIFNSYGTAQDFLNAVLDRDEGVEPENIKTYHMPRQYHLSGYKHWEPGRKMDKTYQGKTPVRQADVRAYEEENVDITVKTEYEIIGEKIGESFTWNIRMNVEYAKKLTDETYLQDGFKNMKLLQASSTAQLPPDAVLDDEHPLLSYANIQLSLIEAIHELISQISQISINDILPYANVDARQAGQQFQLQEDVEKEKLIKRVVSKIKK